MALSAVPMYGSVTCGNTRVSATCAFSNTARGSVCDSHALGMLFEAWYWGLAEERLQEAPSIWVLLAGRCFPVLLSGCAAHWGPLCVLTSSVLLRGFAAHWGPLRR